MCLKEGVSTSKPEEGGKEGLLGGTWTEAKGTLRREFGPQERRMFRGGRQDLEDIGMDLSRGGSCGPISMRELGPRKEKSFSRRESDIKRKREASTSRKGVSSLKGISETYTCLFQEAHKKETGYK